MLIDTRPTRLELVLRSILLLTVKVALPSHPSAVTPSPSHHVGVEVSSSHLTTHVHRFLSRSLSLLVSKPLLSRVSRQEASASSNVGYEYEYEYEYIYLVHLSGWRSLKGKACSCRKDSLMTRACGVSPLRHLAASAFAFRLRKASSARSTAAAEQ